MCFIKWIPWRIFLGTINIKEQDFHLYRFILLSPEDTKSSRQEHCAPHSSFLAYKYTILIGTNTKH